MQKAMDRPRYRARTTTLEGRVLLRRLLEQRGLTTVGLVVTDRCPARTTVAGNDIERHDKIELHNISRKVQFNY